jgi:hypothetical protein
MSPPGSARQRQQDSPFPLPFLPEPTPPLSSSRRVQQRHRHSSLRTSIYNRCVHSLNMLASSFAPLHSLDNLFSSRNSISSPSNRLSEYVLSASSRYASRLVDSTACSDALSPTTSIMPYATSSVSPSVVPIVAHKVSLPEAAGTVDLLSMLPPSVATQYASADHIVLPQFRPQVKRLRAPSVFAVSRHDYITLLRRMLDANMLWATTSPKAVNGLFGVPKPDGSIRVIVAAVPANRHFVEPPNPDLPTPSSLADLVPVSSSPFFISKSDQDNFYHRFRTPRWLWDYMALPPVSAEDLGIESHFGFGTQVFPCCTTLPMGWNHAVYLAQTAHIHFITTKVGWSLSDRISTSDNTLDRTRWDCYLDDVYQVGPDLLEQERRHADYRTLSAAHGLQTKESKDRAPSSDPVEVIGCEVDGRRHTVGVSPTRLASLCRETTAVLRAGLCSGELMSHLLGKWAWAMLVRRPALSIFGSVYRFARLAGSRCFSLWTAVVHELQCAVGVAPLLFVRLSSKVLPRCVAVDASSVGLGVVTARLPPGDVCPHVLSPADFSWSTIVSTPWRESEHINSLELRAISTAVRWALKSPDSIASRLIVFSDSQVAVFSSNKGRSSSHLLLRRLRPLAACLLSSGLRLLLRWIPSEDNPADGPSRLQNL